MLLSYMSHAYLWLLLYMSRAFATHLILQRDKVKLKVEHNVYQMSHSVSIPHMIFNTLLYMCRVCS
jgi:hypothetical protein